MDEKETIKEGETKGAEDGVNKGDEPQAVDYVERAEKAALELKTERELLEKTLIELKELRARNIIGGRTTGGQSPVKEPEESAREYSDKVLKGQIPFK